MKPKPTVAYSKKDNAIFLANSRNRKSSFYLIKDYGERFLIVKVNNMHPTVYYSITQIKKFPELKPIFEIAQKYLSLI